MQIFLNIPSASTSIDCPARNSTIRGVTIGASSVDTVVIPTENATSPWHKKLMILLDTPPGQQPTRMIPADRYGLSPNNLERPNATKGITVNCAIVPNRISVGRRRRILKSSVERVHPIVSIMMPNITFGRCPCCTHAND